MLLLTPGFIHLFPKVPWKRSARRPKEGSAKTTGLLTRSGCRRLVLYFGLAVSRSRNLEAETKTELEHALIQPLTAGVGAAGDG